jgi:hypothetical protein
VTEIVKMEARSLAAPRATRRSYEDRRDNTASHRRTPRLCTYVFSFSTSCVADDVTRELEADFLADLRCCVRFSADEYDARRISSRLVDSVMRLCSPLI